MTARRRWGKAGVPLTDAEARLADQRRGLDNLHAQRALDQARRNYRDHKLIPARITAALDLRALYGPEVDEACGAAEPDVDRWEAGELYPTWEQLTLLSKLTDLPLSFFFIEWPSDDGKPVWTSLQWHLPDAGEPEPPIMRFKPEAFTAAPTPVQGTLL